MGTSSYPEIAVIDCGIGNLASIQNALNYIGASSEIIRDPARLSGFVKIILPGVGAFGEAIANLRQKGFDEALHEAVTRGVSLFGICLGMQLLFSSSREFGFHPGLDLLPGVVLPLEEIAGDLSVPHVGWSVVQRAGDSRLLAGISDEDLCFYFVHSYYCRSADRQAVTGVVTYGESIDVIVETENLFGCQFHPEKSQKSGLKILENYLKL